MILAPDANAAFEKSPILLSATQIISAHLGNNPVALPDVPGFIRTVFSTLSELEWQQGTVNHQAPAAAFAQLMRTEAPVPAADIDASVHHDYIICLEDGKKLRMLKRYLMSQYKMTPEQYRAKWGLPDDYPMVAPAVSEQRRRAAVDSGLGRPALRKPAPRRRRAAR